MECVSNVESSKYRCGGIFGTSCAIGLKSRKCNDIRHSDRLADAIAFDVIGTLLCFEAEAQTVCRAPFRRTAYIEKSERVGKSERCARLCFYERYPLPDFRLPHAIVPVLPVCLTKFWRSRR